VFCKGPKTRFKAQASLNIRQDAPDALKLPFPSETISPPHGFIAGQNAIQGCDLNVHNITMPEAEDIRPCFSALTNGKHG
jgi:hypothetical protein